MNRLIFLASFLVISCSSFGMNPLLAAAKVGDEARVRGLLAAKVDVMAPGRFGETALHVAAAGGYAAIVKLLLEAGAEVNAVDNFGQMPLHRTTSQVLQLLLDAGAELNAKTNNQHTPLDRAILEEKTEVVALLRAAGAQATDASKNGSHILYCAAAYARQRGGVTSSAR